MSVTRSGYIVPESPEIKSELTIRPIVNTEFGFAPPAFKVFRKAKTGELCVPYYYAREKFGVPGSDKRPEPVRVSVQFTGTLRDETRQNEAFNLAIQTGHGVLSLPCGFGKTTVALAVASRLGYRTMIIVHKEFLANQWRERIRQFCPGATIGLVQQDVLDTEHDFVIAMLQSLSMKEYTFENFESFGTVIVDEAHHICAKVFSQALFKMCPRHIYGLSATPNRKDGLTNVLHWFMGPTFLTVERENQKQVTVTPVVYNSPHYNDPPPCNRIGKLSLVQMISDVVDDIRRDEVIVGLIRTISQTSRKLLVLSERRLHCERLHGHFPTTSGLYMGGMKESDLAESSEKQIIFGTFSQAHEGLDIPTLDSLILATPKSDIKQSIGRIMREGSTKQNAPHIWDIWDQWSILNSMYMKRRKVYKEGGFLIESGPTEEPELEPSVRGKPHFLTKDSSTTPAIKAKRI